MKQNNIWFSLVLALIFWAFVPQRMMAEEVHVSTYQEFKKQMKNCIDRTLTIVLDNDLVVDDSPNGNTYFNVYYGTTNLTIRLNGHHIIAQNAPADTYLFDVYGDATFTIENGNPESGKQGQIQTSNSLLYVNSGAICYLKFVCLESQRKALLVNRGAKVYISGESNVFKCTSEAGVPIDAGSNSTIIFGGQCELIGYGNNACLTKDETASVNVVDGYILQDELGEIISLDDKTWSRNYVRISKDPQYPEACKDGEHDLEFHAAKNPTCTEDGNLAYYQCKKCLRSYKDEAANEVFYKFDYIQPALGHDFSKDDKCQRDGCNAIREYISLQDGENVGLEFKEYTDWEDGEEYKAFNLFKYVPSKSCEVTFSSYDIEYLTAGILLDKDKNVLAINYDNPSVSNFSITYQVEAGKEYFLGVQCGNNSAIKGSILVSVPQTAESYTLTDGEVYRLSQRLQVETFAYQRTISEEEVGKWQALFVPFQMSYDDWKDDFDVAAINNIHEYYVATGGVNKREMEIRRITQGKLYASFPYLIRAKSAGVKTITLKNTALQPYNASSSRSMEFGNTMNKGIYKIVGIFDSENSYFGTSFLAIQQGDLLRANGGDPLESQRWYLLPLYNDSGEAKPLDISHDESFAKIAIREIGSGATTGIEEIKVVSSELNDANASSASGIYDLSGCRLNAVKKGVNIIRQADGTVRKVIVK